MYRHSPWCDHRFRSSKPRLTPRNAVGFFGSGRSPSHLAKRITQSILEPATYWKPALSTVDETNPNTESALLMPRCLCNLQIFRGVKCAVQVTEDKYLAICVTGTS